MVKGPVRDLLPMAASGLGGTTLCTNLYQRSLLEHRRRTRATDRLLPREHSPSGR